MSDSIFIREATIDDAPLMLEWENNPVNWEFSETTSPYSLVDMILLVKALEDVKTHCQSRSIICLAETGMAIGTVDLFEIDWSTKTSGVGILIANESHRRKGYGLLAIKKVMEFATESFDINNFECSIHLSNEKSINLFIKAGFIRERDDLEEGICYLKKII